MSPELECELGAEVQEAGGRELKRLTPRHRAMLRAIFAGGRVTEVAQHLGCSRRTLHRVMTSTQGREYLRELQEMSDERLVDYLALAMYTRQLHRC